MIMQAPPAAPSLSVFFTAYNDSGTIASLVIRALHVAATLTDDYEVIVVNDGSKDGTGEILDELTRVYPEHFRVVHHEINRGYGGALRSGFAAATKDLVFYTDGDAQYDASEVTRCIDAARADIDVVQGYKIGRGDRLYRKVIGRTYHHVVRVLFGLRVRDTDCDFRLIRRDLLARVELTSTSGVICVEMMRKFQHAGARFAEVGVSHYPRPYGHSQFFRLPAIARHGRVSIAVSTDGASPALARRLRDRAGALLTEEVVALAADLAARRAEVRAAGGSTEDVDWSELIDAVVPPTPPR